MLFETPIPPNLDTPAFREVWKDFIEHRKEIRHRMTERAERTILKRMSRWTEAAAIEAMEVAISGGWQNVFEPKPSGNFKIIATTASQSAEAFELAMKAAKKYGYRITTNYRAGSEPVVVNGQHLGLQSLPDKVRRAAELFGWRSLCEIPAQNIGMARAQFMKLYEAIGAVRD